MVRFIPRETPAAGAVTPPTVTRHPIIIPSTPNPEAKMKITELITELTKIYREHGDLDGPVAYTVHDC